MQTGLLTHNVTKLPSKEIAMKLMTPTARAALSPTKKGLMPSFLRVRKLVFNPTPAKATTRKFPAQVLMNV